MIYCVAMAEVSAHLRRLGFEDIGGGASFRAFADPNGSVLTIRRCEDDGQLTEISVNDAFDAAGLSPPDWSVFWCD